MTAIRRSNSGSGASRPAAVCPSRQAATGGDASQPALLSADVGTPRIEKGAVTEFSLSETQTEEVQKSRGPAPCTTSGLQLFSTGRLPR